MREKGPVPNPKLCTWHNVLTPPPWPSPWPSPDNNFLQLQIESLPLTSPTCHALSLLFSPFLTLSQLCSFFILTNGCNCLPLIHGIQNTQTHPVISKTTPSSPKIHWFTLQVKHLDHHSSSFNCSKRNHKCRHLPAPCAQTIIAQTQPQESGALHRKPGQRDRQRHHRERHWVALFPFIGMWRSWSDESRDYKGEAEKESAWRSEFSAAVDNDNRIRIHTSEAPQRRWEASAPAH